MNNKEENKGYQELQIFDDWSTRFELGGKPLDFTKHYDIITLNGLVYKNCAVRCLICSHRILDRILGGMKSWTTRIPYFETDGLDIMLQSGFLMKISEI